MPRCTKEIHAYAILKTTGRRRMRPTPESKKPRKGLWTALGLVLLAVAGALEKRDMELAAARYCRNVAEGVWPDYAGAYRTQCTAPASPKTARSSPAR